MTQVLRRVSELSRASLVAAMAGIAACWTLPLAAQEPNATADALLQEDIQAAQLVERLQNLVLSQQRQIARELIRKYPDTDLAQRARDLLQQLELYDTLEAAEFSRDLARTDWVRNFWDARRPAPPVVIDMDVRITNSADVAAIFQVRGPGTEWSHPIALTPGESMRLKYPAEYRQVTPEVTHAHLLNLGQSYTFLKGPGDARPRLYHQN
jgi:hypothetical protein